VPIGVEAAAAGLAFAKSARARLFRRQPHHAIPPETDRSPDDIGVPEFSQHWQEPNRYARFWPGQRAFALPTFYDGRVRVNLAGRERDGVIAAEDYARTLDWVEEELTACRDIRSGQSMVDDVVRLRAADPFEPDGPDADLVVTWARRVDAVEHPRAGTIGPVPLRRSGGHSPNGFAIVAGPGIAPGAGGTRPIADIPATLLALLGVRSAMAIDGRSLIERELTT
jgi:predicted AlkP superfamily phosphohydrolase/phosphomutase